jgi:hypothetical protein
MRFLHCKVRDVQTLNQSELCGISLKVFIAQGLQIALAPVDGRRTISPALRQYVTVQIREPSFPFLDQLQRLPTTLLSSG